MSNNVDPAVFWLDRWANGQLGWHQLDVNPRLARYWPTLDLDSQGSVFVPLCGKSLDMHWLRGQGHPIVGVDIARTALDAFYAEASLTYEYAPDLGGIACLSHDDRRAPSIRLYCGDFFELSAPHLGRLVGTYDRGALVALPPAMRATYADHLQRIIPDASDILLLALEYDQSAVGGPPYSVSSAEVELLYGERCQIDCLDVSPALQMPPHFVERGVAEGRESVYRIHKVD